jgi:thymidylate kinase
MDINGRPVFEPPVSESPVSQPVIHRLAGKNCPWITLLGVDGSGKSTVLAELEQSLAGTAYSGLFVLHRRPQLVYRTASASREGSIEHYGKAPHGRFLSAVKLAAMWLDWLLGYFVLIRGRRVQGILVVADRHSLLDILVDPLRYRYGGSLRWVETAVRFLPMPDVIVLLDAPTAVLQSRKQELTEVQTAHLRHNYLKLVQAYPPGYVVDASQPAAQVVADVQRIVLQLRQK